jgi:hypothetical protein
VTYVRLKLSFDHYQNAYYHKIFRELLVTQRRLRRVELAQRPCRGSRSYGQVSCDNIKEKLSPNPLSLVRLAIR